MKDTATIAREKARHKQFIAALKMIGFSTAMLVMFVILSISASASEQILEPLPEYDTNGRQLAFASNNAPRIWAGKYVCVKHNPEGAPDNIDGVIEYMLWSWGQRTDLRLDYQGVTSETQIDGCIVIQWMTHIEMWNERNSFLVTGFTHSRFYTSTNVMVSARLVLRSDEWENGVQASAKAAHTAIHELGHAIGISGHSENEQAIMFPNRLHGRYAITAFDVQLTAYSQELCHAELTPHGDVYIPAINGAGVTLKPVEGILTIEHEHHTGLDCSGSWNGSEAVIYDVRGYDGSYSNVRLKPVEGGFEIVDYD